MPAIFIGLVCAAFGAWLFAVVEMIATRVMASWCFRIGPVVLTRVLTEPESIAISAVEGHKGKLGNLRYRRLSANRWIFHVAQPLIGFRMHTPFPFKATLQLTESSQHLEARLPLGTSMFFALWLAGWCAGAVRVAVHGTNSSNLVTAAVFGCLGVGVACGMIWFSLRVERQRLFEALRGIGTREAQ